MERNIKERKRVMAWLLSVFIVSYLAFILGRFLLNNAMKTWNRKRREEIRRKKMENDYYAEYEVIEGKGRKVYHVVYQDEVWKVKQERGYTIANGKFDNKAEAVERAKEAAKRAKLGQVIVHKRDGKFQTEYTYGDDPKESKG